MTERIFVDTNVWVYAVDPADPDKRLQARAVLAAEDAVIVTSAQVLAEFFVTISRKLPSVADAAIAEGMLEQLRELPIVAVDAGLAFSAIGASREWQISYWDALIIRAAEVAGCSKVISEDLTAGRTYGSVVIENPFAV